MPSTATPIDLEVSRKSDTIARLCNLPRLDPSAARLLGVPDDIDSALEEFGAIFSTDPSLAAELLRVANSAQFELRASVSNLQFALMMLGIEGTRNLAFTIALRSYVHRGLSSAQVRPLWLHSVATAVIAEQISKCVAVESGDLFTAGLTHDLGRLGLLQSQGRRYAETLSKTFTCMDEANAMEKILFGMTHAEAGGHLAHTWGFPSILGRSIRAHHDCLTEDHGRSLRIVQQACIVAANLGYPELENCPVAEADEAFRDEFQSRPELAPERLKALIQLRTQAD